MSIRVHQWLKNSAPILLEPVRAQITLPGQATLHLLDQDGIAPTASRPARGTFAINGTQDQTPFYLLKR